MTFATLVWGSPAWVWAAVTLTAVGFIVLAWSYRSAPASWGVRVLATGLKVLGIIALVLCLVEPLVSSVRPRPGANVFVLLADDSASLQIRDPGTKKSRAEMLRELLEDETDWETRLEQDFDVRSYRFADRLQPLDEETELTAGGVGSRLGNALETVGRRFRGRPVAGILVFSDGNATDLSESDVDWPELPPVYPVMLGTRSSVRDVDLGQVSVSQTNFEQSPVTIRAEVAATGYGREKLAVQLLDESGDQLEEQTIEVSEGEPRTVRFRLRPERPGVSFYQVRVARASELHRFEAPEKSSEATFANNTRIVTVHRPRGPYRVLYVAGRPNWEFKFLRRAVAEDDEVELVGLIRIAKREPKFTYLGHTGERTNPLYRGFTDADEEQAEEYDEPVIIRLGTRDDVELRGGFPKTADDLYPYHAVILDDVEARFFTQDQMLLLQRFVSRRGGGFLMLGGAESFRQGEYRRTPVGELLPVYLGRKDEAPRNARYRLHLTREGWLQPWIRLRETEEQENSRLATMPAFQTLNRTSGIKPGASVLAEVVDDAGKKQPALVAQRFGKGRAAALMIGDVWQWTLQRKAGEEDDSAKAWRQTVRWLVADVPRRVELNVQSTRERAGGPVEISVQARDAEFQPLDNGKIELTITTPHGSGPTEQSHSTNPPSVRANNSRGLASIEQSQSTNPPPLAKGRPGGGDNVLNLRVQPSDQRAGTYVATYMPKEPGAYLARAIVTAADGSDVGSQDAGWTAEPAAEEFRHLAPDFALLERIARETGGEVVAPDELGRFVADLPNRKIPITEAWMYPLWHHPMVLVFAMVCLIAEWGLRRWKGLP